MTFAIPSTLKELNALGFNELLPVELNDTDVDRMMSALLERTVKHGRVAGSKTDARDYDRYLDTLCQHDQVRGLTAERRQAVLDGWIRSSVLQVGRGGLGRRVAQMDYVRPVTIAVYRSGLPKTRSRNRKTDDLVYQALHRLISDRGSHRPEADLARIFQQTFGAGVEVGVSPWSDPRYDGHSDLDIGVLLTLRFLEGFEGHTNPKASTGEPDIAVPGAVLPLATDVLDYLQLYGTTLPPLEASQHLAGLISLRLFQLPLRTAAAARQLLADGTVCDDMVHPAGPNRLEIYCDFTRRRGGPSDEVARQCVQRDLDLLRQFFADRLLLRSLHQTVPLLGQTGQQLAELPIAEQLAALARERTNPQIEMALGMQLMQIETHLPDPPEGDEARDYIATVRASGLSASDQLTSVLVEGLRKRGLENQVKWFWSTGGINKPYGLLSGALKSRLSWRYAPSDELLTAILMVCFSEADGTRTAARLPIAELLRRLETRFGLLIDRPPRYLDTADGRAGASENLEAFTRTLQLLGCFNSLSDDFSAQSVTRPRSASA